MSTKTLYKHIFAVILVFSMASASLAPLFDARAESADVPPQVQDQSVITDPSPSPSSTPEPKPSSDASVASDAPEQSPQEGSDGGVATTGDSDEAVSSATSTNTNTSDANTNTSETTSADTTSGESENGAGNSSQGAFDLAPVQNENGSASTTSTVVSDSGEGNATTTDAGIETNAEAGSSTEASAKAGSSSSTSTASTTPDTTDVSSENSAEVANGVAGDASSGGNSASGNASSSDIVTGDSTAGANVANFVNTNIVGGDVVVVSLNATSTEGDIDLRGSVGTTTEATSTCRTECLGSLTVENANTATTTNDISLSVSSGSNTASDNNGDAMVITGDATAAANVINFLNANFVQSQFLFVAINNLGDFDGDLVFPGKWFFERLWGTDAGGGNGEDALGEGGTLHVENDNTAAIRNIVVMEGESGANEAVDNAGAAAISTGEAATAANILTLANTNLLGGTPIYILLNVGGKWGGTVFSIPQGAEWKVEGGKLVIEKENALSSSGASLLPSDTHVSNANAVSLVNAIRLSASSGRNRASGNKGNVRIRTGNAFAAANILNVVNTNIIGLNGLFALINISGNWNGNIAFGRPDLWLGSAATLSEQPARVHTGIGYTFTIRNNGDADATRVRLRGTFNTNHLGLEDAGGGIIGDSGAVTWDIGAIPVGGAVTRTLRAYVANLPIGTTDLAHSFSVSGFETDANTRDNTDSLVILAERSSVRAPYVVTGSWPPELVIAKTHEGPDEITASSTVHYKISVMNVGMGPAYDAYVIDRVMNAKRKTIDASRWNLGDIYPRQEVIIEYDLEYASTTPAGMYTNYAWAWARGGTAQGYVVGVGPATSTINVVRLGAGASGHPPFSTSAGNGSDAASEETGVLAHDGGAVQLSSVHEKPSFSSEADDNESVPTTIIHVQKKEPARRILLPSPLGISAKKSSSGGLQGLPVVGDAHAAGSTEPREFAQPSQPSPSTGLFASVMGARVASYLWLLPGLIILFVIAVFKRWMRVM